MGITVIVVLAEEQHAPLAHELDDFRIGLEHTEAGKVIDFGVNRPALSTGQ
jgi:hypothetical protein